MTAMLPSPSQAAEMAQQADALIAVWDGASKGTAHMIDLGRKYGLLINIQRCAVQR